MFSKQRLYFLYFSVDWKIRTCMIQELIAGCGTNVFSARAQNKNTDEEAFGNVQSRTAEGVTLRRSFRRTETKSGVVSGESQKMSAEGAMHSLLVQNLSGKRTESEEVRKTGSYGFYFSGPCSPDGRMVFSWEERGTSGRKGDIKS